MPAESIIKEFHDASELDKEVALMMIEDFKQPGLVLLPVGATFQKTIYPKVEEYFSFNQKTIHPELKLSHLDELSLPFMPETDSEDIRFSTALKKSLPSVLAQTSFHSLQVRELNEFDRFIKNSGGPRRIYMGLGADPAIAHVAFIGEAGYLNSSTEIVPLSFSESRKHNFAGQKISHAATMGTDIFELNNLKQKDSLIVVVIGAAKSKALAQAFKDADTGLGYLIANHGDKLKIYADSAALADYKAEQKW